MGIKGSTPKRDYPAKSSSILGLSWYVNINVYLYRIIVSCQDDQCTLYLIRKFISGMTANCYMLTLGELYAVNNQMNDYGESLHMASGSWFN